MTTKVKQRLTIFIHLDIAKHAKAQAIIEGDSLSTLVEKALVEYLPEETVIKKVKIKS